MLIALYMTYAFLVNSSQFRLKFISVKGSELIAISNLASRY